MLIPPPAPLQLAIVKQKPNNLYILVSLNELYLKVSDKY